MYLLYELKNKLSYIPFFKDKFTWVSSLISIGLHGVAWCLIFFWLLPVSKGLNSPVIPLHYTIYFGVDYAGTVNQIYILGLLGFIFLVIDISLCVILYSRMRILAYILSILMALVQIILVIGLVLITLFNS